MSYVKTKTYGGQVAATELVKKSLENNGLRIIDIFQFPVERGITIKVFQYLVWAMKSISALPAIINLLFTAKPILYINLGQGYFSFFRVIWWYGPIRLLKPGMHVVISLHGHVFMSWSSKALLSKIFRTILKSSNIITVLGKSQKEKLINLGVNKEKLRIVSNTCEYSPATKDFILKKHNIRIEQPINILHLGLLIESKGFPEYLEALALLSNEDFEQPVHAVLCGPISASSYCVMLKSAEEKERWIKEKIGVINKKIRVEWIPGARGIEKEALYKKSHIFVLPSYFPVEAQPLVLLEAMANGCSIITSSVGEIPETVEESALMLREINPENVAMQIRKYIDEPALRIENALAGLEIYKQRFSHQAYQEAWQDILLNKH